MLAKARLSPLTAGLQKSPPPVPAPRIQNSREKSSDQYPQLDGANQMLLVNGPWRRPVRAERVHLPPYLYWIRYVTVKL